MMPAPALNDLKAHACWQQESYGTGMTVKCSMLRPDSLQNTVMRDRLTWGVPGEYSFGIVLECMHVRRDEQK